MGGYAFVGLDDDAADSALEATTVLPPQWLVSWVSAHQGQRVGM